MTVVPRPNKLKLVREADGLELDLQPLHGLWTAPQYQRGDTASSALLPGLVVDVDTVFDAQ